MDTKATAPAPMYPQAGMADAPPSYEASVGPQPNYGPAQDDKKRDGAKRRSGHSRDRDSRSRDRRSRSRDRSRREPVQEVVVVEYQGMYRFGPFPIRMKCPHCHRDITTSISTEPGVWAWVFFGLLCAVGFWPCAIIPCCMDSLKNVVHECPNCGVFLGRYRGTP